jgi:phosphoribosyl 1,2-cyclic phosphate phosphodiesterase
VAIQSGSSVVLIDTSPDLHSQAVYNKLHWLDAVCFTHAHADHIHGIDELRSFNFLMARPIDCYGNKETIHNIETRFDYIFNPHSQKGGGKPALRTHVVRGSFGVKGLRIQPLELIHGKMPVLGFRINDVAYITDCSYIPEKTFRYLKGLDVLVLDCLRYDSHPTHLNVSSALKYALQIGAKKTFFTHMGHDIEYRSFAKSLPRGIYPAYDGLLIRSK